MISEEDYANLRREATQQRDLKNELIHRVNELSLKISKSQQDLSARLMNAEMYLAYALQWMDPKQRESFEDKHGSYSRQSTMDSSF